MRLIERQLCVISAALISAVVPAYAGDPGAPNLDTDLDHWMAFAPDAARLGELTIPGSHDSGALFEPFPGTAICQDLGIADQLQIGVRYLDIRLRQIDNALVVHHGSVYQHQNFDDVLIQVTGFLQAHPSEMVIMEVSPEHTPSNNTETYEQTFLRYVANPSYHDFWWRQRSVPALGEVRGKIVLLRRFTGSPELAGGIDATGWPENAQFTLTDASGTRITVQDDYVVSLTTSNTKWNQITALLAQAAADPGSTWYLNFTSGVRSILGIPNVTGVADDINSRLFDNFAFSQLHHSHAGTVISDFVNQQTIQQLLRVYFF